MFENKRKIQQGKCHMEVNTEQQKFRNKNGGNSNSAAYACVFISAINALWYLKMMQISLLDHRKMSLSWKSEKSFTMLVVDT